jgi:HEAT repeat protein
MTRFVRLIGIVVCATAVQAADVGDLVNQLKSDDQEERRAAAKALGEGGAQSKEAVPDLIKALKDRDTFVRRFAAQALGAIGPDAQRAIPALKMTLNDSHKEVQEAAVRALGKLGLSGIEALVVLVKDDNKDTTIRRKAIDSLSSLGRAGRVAVPVLTNLLKPPTGKNKKKAAPDELRIAATVALGSLAMQSDTQTIKTLESLADKMAKVPSELRQAANQSLRKIRQNK